MYLKYTTVLVWIFYACSLAQGFCALLREMWQGHLMSSVNIYLVPNAYHETVAAEEDH